VTRTAPRFWITGVTALALCLAGCKRDPVRAPSAWALKGESGLTSVLSFSADGRMLAAGLADKTVCVWDPASGRRIARRTAPAGPVRALAFSPVGNWLAAGGADGRVCLWGVPDRWVRGPRRTRHDGGVTSVCFSADGRTLATGGADGTVKVWSVVGRTGRITLQHTLQAHRIRVRSVAIAPDGGLLVSAADEGDRPSYVLLWDLEGAGPKLRWTVTSERGGGNRLIEWMDWAGFLGDGRSVLTTGHGYGSLRGEQSRGAEAELRIWDARTGDEIRRLKLGQKSGQACSADGSLFVTGWGWEGREGVGANVLDLRTGKAVRNLSVGGKSDEVEELAFSPDGKTVAGAARSAGVWRTGRGGGAAIWLWDLSQSAEEHR
jgi:WD40 repeat protein